MHRPNNSHLVSPYNTIGFMGMAVYLLASPGFYMSLGLLWFDVINIFNANYDRQSLGFMLSSDNMDPIFRVMGIVSKFGLVFAFVGVIGMVIKLYRYKK